MMEGVSVRSQEVATHHREIQEQQERVAQAATESTAAHIAEQRAKREAQDGVERARAVVGLGEASATAPKPALQWFSQQQRPRARSTSMKAGVPRGHGRGFELSEGGEVGSSSAARARCEARRVTRSPQSRKPSRESPRRPQVRMMDLASGSVSGKSRDAPGGAELGCGDRRRDRFVHLAARLALRRLPGHD